ncbi:MAG TPA: hypothetical protein VJ873_04120 [bacterium]|nr:hypothetical protein [bacterium]
MKVVIQNKILKELKKYLNAKTSVEAVNIALEKVINDLKIKKLKSLKGKFLIRNNWKQLRALELKESRITFGSSHN